MKLLSLALITASIMLPAQAAEMTQQATPEATQESTQTAAVEPATQGNTAASGWVARAALTTAVQDREPIDSVSSLSNDKTTLYYFTEVRDMAGQTIKHRWEHNGEVMAEVEFQIGGPRWRIYSSKTLVPTWLGDWKVSATDAAGNPLSVNNFVYTEAATISEQTGTPTASEQPKAIGTGEQTGATGASEQKPQ
jgi:hypothetical protein